MSLPGEHGAGSHLVHHLGRKTVFSSEDLPQGGGLRDMGSIRKALESRVEEFVKELVSEMDESLTASRWSDPEFGPNLHDPLGQMSLYRNARVAGPGYPNPEEVKWARPSYGKSWHGSEEFFVGNAGLFKNPVSEATVIQGKLGNCWFLNAVSIAATRPGLMESCFWRNDDFKNYGIFVCKFFKNGAWYYVVVDDRIPVFACDHGQHCFAKTRDAGELWLPVLEKAYAKLHFSYDSLAGGRLEVALSEISGFTVDSKFLIQRSFDSEAEWMYLRSLIDYGSAVGAIVSPEDTQIAAAAEQQEEVTKLVTSRHELPAGKLLNSGEPSTSVVPSAIRGLEKRHAYGIVAAKKINHNTRLLLVQNPWGFGMWTGAWSRNSEVFQHNREELRVLFPDVHLESTHHFLISWEDFCSHFTSFAFTIQIQPVFDDLNLRARVLGSQWSGGYVAIGSWDEETAGGSYDKETWFINPVFRFKIHHSQTRIFVRLALRDERLENSASFRRGGPLFSFSICTLQSGKPVCPQLAAPIPGSNPHRQQASFTFGPACTREVILSSGNYAIVPNTFDRRQNGSFVLTIHFDKPVFMEGALPMEIQGSAAEQANSFNETMPSDLRIHEIPDADEDRQRAERVEAIKDKLAQVAVERGLNYRRMLTSFQGELALNRFEFKQRMVGLGYNVSEIPDAEFEELAFPDSRISERKLRQIFEVHLLREALAETEPEPPVDDLMFRPPATNDGVLVVKVGEGQDLILGDGNSEDETKTLFAFNIISAGKARALCVHRSGLYRIANRLCIVQIWAPCQLEKFSTELSRLRSFIAGATVCTPIVFDVEDGREYGFLDRPWRLVRDHEAQNQSFWNELCKIWATSEAVDHSPLVNVISDNGGETKADCFVPDRTDYLRQVLHDFEVELKNIAVGSSRGPSKFGAGSGTYDPFKENLVSNLRTRTKFKDVESVANTVSGSLDSLQKLDLERNAAFFKLKKCERESRRMFSRFISTGRLDPPEISPEERAEESSESSSVVEGEKDAESKKERTNETHAFEPLTFAIAQSIKNELVDGAILERVDEFIQFGRKEEVSLGGWIHWKDPSSEKHTQASNLPPGRHVHCSIMQLPGEARVLREQLSRTENLLAWFRRFDRDSNGRIDKTEFTYALESLGFELSEHDLRSLLNHLDQDGDGTISPTEFVRFVAGEDDIANLPSENIVSLQAMISALASEGVDKDMLGANWSIGLSWFKLHHLASQLRDFTKRCSEAEQRSLFAAIPQVVAVRAYRIAHLFETQEAFINFLERQHKSGTLSQKKPPVTDPKAARKVLTRILEQVQQGSLAYFQVSQKSQEIIPSKNELQLDLVMKRLPAFVEQTLQVSIRDGKVKSGLLATAVLKSHSKTLVAEEMAKKVRDLGNDHDQVIEMEKETMDSVMKSLIADVLDLNQGEEEHTIRLTLAEQVRMLIDDALIFCKANYVNRAALARMIAPSNVKHVADKLRHVLNEKKATRKSPQSYLLDVYVSNLEELSPEPSGSPLRRLEFPASNICVVLDRRSSNRVFIDRIDASKENYNNAEKQPARIHILARNPGNGREIWLKDVDIPEDLKYQIPGSHLSTPRGIMETWLWFKPGKVQVFSAGEKFGTELQKFLPEFVFERSSNAGLSSCLLEDLVKRLVLTKSAESSGDRLALLIKEAPQKVQYVKSLLENASPMPFFFQLSELGLDFMVDAPDGNDCKNIVLSSLRRQQGGRLAKALIELNSVLSVVFEQTHGDFREEMSWREFAAYLSQRRNPALKVLVRPGDFSFVSSVAFDGGCNPSFRDALLTVPFQAPQSVNRNLVMTRVCKIQDRYVVLFLHHKEDSSRIGIVAYDPRSNDEYSVALKTLKKELRRRRNAPVLQVWGSPKRRARKSFAAAWAQPLQNDESIGNQEEIHEPETVQMMNEFGVSQESEEAGVTMDSTFPLQSESAWESFLKHVKLGACLTPHIEFIAENHMESQLCRVGNCRFPLSLVTNSPGKMFDQWLQLKNVEGFDVGKLKVSVRFDDALTSKEMLKPDDEEEEQALLHQRESKRNEDDIGLEILHHRAKNAKDYTLLAQRLRDEVLETRAKLATSEKSRVELERTVRASEERLRQTRFELDHHQRQLDHAEEEYRLNEPRRPKRGARVEDFEEYSRLVKEHQSRVRELEILRSENEKLRHITDSKEKHLDQELRSLQEKLHETEMKLRLEVTEKQELLSTVEKANADAYAGLAKTAAQIPGTKGKISRKPKEQRQKERRRREEWLQTQLGADYNTYKREFDGCTKEIQRQLAARMPEKPEQPIASLEGLLLANARITHPEPKVSAEAFGDILASFGLSISPRDLDLLKAHFDTHTDNNISIDDFLDTLREFKRPQSPATTGFRGVQTVQRNKAFKHSYGR